MASVMGCNAGGHLSPSETADAIKAALAPMWKTLPKNRAGKVEWRMLRYAAHRYFMQQSSLLVKGFEPQRRVNSSTLGSAEILSQRGESVIDALLMGKVNGQGFSLDDVAFMVATLEQVIYDSESLRLERAYREHYHIPIDMLSHGELVSVIETYMMLWMLGDDEQSIEILLREPKLIHEVFPLWTEVHDFTNGMVKKMEYERSRSPQAGQGYAAWGKSYSFKESHEAVGHITRNFASFWEAECQSIKRSLVDLDKLGIGRVTLPDFYGANTEGEWRFGESEAYLRELGALDDTSARRGKQVIIPNYLQGASNCIVTTPHYMVCCMNECEDMLTDIERVVGSPLADPDVLLSLISNMTDFDDNAPTIDGTLASQLRRIAEINGGQVPLHGRLFAKWMHYVFPQECPYPHKVGAASAVSMTAFGSQSFASDLEVKSHAATRNFTVSQISDVEEAQWMSQWSEEEELNVDSVLPIAPWERAGGWVGCSCGGAGLLALAWSLVAGAFKGQKNLLGGGAKPLSHFV